MAISLRISQAVKLEGTEKICVFTDHIAAAKRAVDPSVHSGQAWSLVVCRALDEWLSANPERTIEFHAVPSKRKWPFHFKIHEHLKNYPCIALGKRQDTTIDCLRKDAVEKVLEEWRQLFNQPSYRG